MLGEHAAGKAKDKGKGFAGRVYVMNEEAVKVRKGGGDVRLVGRRRGVGQVGQG